MQSKLKSLIIYVGGDEDDDYNVELPFIRKCIGDMIEHKVSIANTQSFYDQFDLSESLDIIMKERPEVIIIAGLFMRLYCGERVLEEE